MNKILALVAVLAATQTSAQVVSRAPAANIGSAFPA